jgi:hypothetical protein
MVVPEVTTTTHVCPSTSVPLCIPRLCSPLRPTPLLHPNLTLLPVQGCHTSKSLALLPDQAGIPQPVAFHRLH